MVWLESNDRLSIWVWGDQGALSTKEPREMRTAGDDSPALLALRSAELLRGQLLPVANSEPHPSKRAPTARHAPPQARLISFTTGPALFLSSYADPQIAVVADAAYYPWTRWGFGAYIHASLSRGTWNVEPAQFSLGQFGAGLQLRAEVFQYSARSALKGYLQIVGRIGGRNWSLRAETGPPETRSSNAASALTFGGGADLSYPLFSWLRVGGLVFVQGGIPLSWPAPTDALNAAQRMIISEQAAASSPDVQFIITPHLTLQF